MLMYVVRYFPQAKTLGVICLRYKVIRCSVFTTSSQMAHNYFAEARLLTKCEKSGAVELEGGRGEGGDPRLNIPAIRWVRLGEHRH